MKKLIFLSLICSFFSLCIVQNASALDLPLIGPSGETILGLGFIKDIAYSPDGQCIATCGPLGAFLWDAETGELLRWFSINSPWTSTVAFSSEINHLLTGNRINKTTTIWDVETGEEIQTIPEYTDVQNSEVVSPDGSRVLRISDDNTVIMYDRETNIEIRSFQGHTEGMISASYSPEGNRVLMVCSNKVKMWDVKTGVEIHSLNLPSGLGFISPDRNRILWLGGEKGATLLDIKTETEINTFHWDLATHPIDSFVTFSLDGSRVAAKAFIDGGINVWNVETGEVIRIWRTLPAAAKLLPDGSRVLTIDRGIFELLDVETGEVIHRFGVHTGRVSALAFSRDGNRVLTGSSNGTIIVLDLNTGLDVQRFEDPEGVKLVAFSPDERYVLTGNETVKLWDVESGENIRTLGRHPWIMSVAFSPDGRHVLTGSEDGTARIWDISDLAASSGISSEEWMMY